MNSDVWGCKISRWHADFSLLKPIPQALIVLLAPFSVYCWYSSLHCQRFKISSIIARNLRFARSLKVKAITNANQIKPYPYLLVISYSTFTNYSLDFIFLLPNFQNCVKSPNLQFVYDIFHMLFRIAKYSEVLSLLELKLLQFFYLFDLMYGE